jgi:hypothetical protein
MPTAICADENSFLQKRKWPADLYFPWLLEFDGMVIRIDSRDASVLRKSACVIFRLLSIWRTELKLAPGNFEMAPGSERVDCGA